MIGAALALLLTATDAGTVEQRLNSLEEELSRTKADLEETKQALEEANTSLEEVKDGQKIAERSLENLRDREEEIRQTGVTWSGYLDVGFFAVQGNGSGIRKDLERLSPSGNDLLATWVFRGDPLATTINSRGEPADIGDSRAIGFDGLRTQGRPSVLVNAVNLQFVTQVGESWDALVRVDMLPRERTVTRFALGDFFDVKLAYVRWQKEFGFGNVTVWGGKVDSVLGIEYRLQESPQRLTVTPSLLCRYTCGRALGVRARGSFFDEKLEVLAAVTNGSNQLEIMPWGAEAGFNVAPMFSGRVGALLPVGEGLELSVNGAVGIQDRQADPTVWQFHAGAAAKLQLSSFVFTVEGAFGRAAGKTGTVNGDAVPCAAASCLVYRGAYAQAGWRPLRWLMPYARIDWRSGTMRDGREWLYESIRARATVGARFEPSHRLAFKAEYTFNREFVGPDFPDDVFTTSLIVSY